MKQTCTVQTQIGLGTHTCDLFATHTCDLGCRLLLLLTCIVCPVSCVSELERQLAERKDAQKDNAQLTTKVQALEHEIKGVVEDRKRLQDADGKHLGLLNEVGDYTHMAPLPHCYPHLRIHTRVHAYRCIRMYRIADALLLASYTDCQEARGVDEKVQHRYDETKD